MPTVHDDADRTLATTVGIVGVGGGGLGADLSATGPGPLYQPSAGAAITVIEKHIILEAGTSAANVNTALAAVATAGGGRVELGAGAFTGHATGYGVGTNTDFCGHGYATQITAPTGATGAVVKLLDEDAHRVTIRDMFINGNRTGGAASVSGVEIDNDNGDFGADGVDPNNKLFNIDVRQCALDGFRLKSRRMIASGLHAANVTLNGMSLLNGSTVGATDCDFSQIALDGEMGGYGLYCEAVANKWSGTIGESTNHCIYLTADAHWNLINATLHNSGYPTYTTPGNPIVCTGNNNVITLMILDGTGIAVKLVSPAKRNHIRATIDQFDATSGKLTYAVLVPSGCTNNVIDVLSDALLTDYIDPTSDLDENLVLLNGADLSQVLMVERFEQVAGTPSASDTGGRIPTWVMGANADQIAGTFQIPKRWRGRKMQATVNYSCNVGDNTKNIQFTIGLSGLPINTAVTTADVTFSETIAAPASASLTNAKVFSSASQLLTIGTADVEGNVTILRDASTTLAGGTNLLIHGAFLRLVG